MVLNPRDPRQLGPKETVPDDGLGQETSAKSSPVVISTEQEEILDGIAKETTSLSINKEVTSLNSKVSTISTSGIVEGINAGLSEIDETQVINQVFTESLLKDILEQLKLNNLYLEMIYGDKLEINDIK